MKSVYEKLEENIEAYQLLEKLVVLPELSTEAKVIIDEGIADDLPDARAMIIKYSLSKLIELCEGETSINESHLKHIVKYARRSIIAEVDYSSQENSFNIDLVENIRGYGYKDFLKDNKLKDTAEARILAALKGVPSSGLKDNSETKQ